jgi:hypothetical protein
MLALTLSSPYPNGRDIWFHILVAHAWRLGLNGMASPVVLDINFIPYPPLFHFLLVPFALDLNASIQAARFLGVFLYPLSVLSWTLLIRKYAGSELALTFSLAIIGTYFSFSQMMSKPESLALLVLPIAVWAFLENRTWSFVAIGAALAYIYSPFSLVLIAGLLGYSLKKSWSSIKVWATAAFSAPMFIYQASFIKSNFTGRWISVGDKGILPETVEFLFNPIGFLLSAFGISLMSFVLIPYSFYKWKEQSRLTKAMLATFLGMLVVWPIWYQRVFSFIMLPCAYITALFIQRQQNRLVKTALLAFLVIQAIVFTLNPVWWPLGPQSWFNQYW